MEKKVFEQKKKVLFLLLLFVILVLLAFGSNALITPKTFDFSQPGTGWSVSRGDELIEDADLYTLNLGETSEGEEITISKTLSAGNMVTPTLMFKSCLSTVEVIVNGENIYSFGQDYYEKHFFVPKKYHLITLDDQALEYNVEIKYTIAEDNAFQYLQIPYFGSRLEVIKHFMQTHRLPIFVGGFFIMFSCILFTLGSFLFLFHKKDITLFSIALISMLFGLYTYCYNDVFCFISNNDLFFSLLEYISLYMIPLSVSILLYSTHSYIVTRLQRTFIFINALLPINFLIMRILGSNHVGRMVNITQLVSVLEILLILPPLVTGIRRSQRERQDSDTYTGINADYYMLLGFIIMIVCAFLEIAKFNINKYRRSENVLQNFDFLTLGALLFIMGLFAYYFFNAIEHKNSSYVKAHLEGLAYTDALTGLMNRAKCMQYAAGLTGSYAVVSLDLDRLKYVNDTFGHLEGDRLISSFADLLKKAFSGASLIARTGGDEFVVVFENPSGDVCEKSLQDLTRYMDDFNQKKDLFTISASAGFAYSSEISTEKFEDVFYLADTRMYEMKEKHHA